MAFAPAANDRTVVKRPYPFRLTIMSNLVYTPTQGSVNWMQRIGKVLSLIISVAMVLSIVQDSLPLALTASR